MSMAPRTKLPILTEALENAAANPKAPQPFCIDRPEFTSNSREDLEYAASQCAERCPLFVRCNASALHERPAWGAHGGIVWIDGRQLHLRRKKNEIPLDLVA